MGQFRSEPVDVANGCVAQIRSVAELARKRGQCGPRVVAGGPIPSPRLTRGTRTCVRFEDARSVGFRGQILLFSGWSALKIQRGLKALN